MRCAGQGTEFGLSPGRISVVCLEPTSAGGRLFFWFSTDLRGKAEYGESPPLQFRRRTSAARSCSDLLRRSFFSIPRRAIRGQMPRLRRCRRHRVKSYPLSAWSLSGRLRGRPDRPGTAGIASIKPSKAIESCQLAPVAITAVPSIAAQVCRAACADGLRVMPGERPVQCRNARWNED